MSLRATQEGCGKKFTLGGGGGGLVYTVFVHVPNLPFRSLLSVHSIVACSPTSLCGGGGESAMNSDIFTVFYYPIKLHT